MADTTTTYYGFTKPEVGASTDSWGQKLNQNWDDVDLDINNIVTGAVAIAPNLTSGSWEIGGTAITTTAAELNNIIAKTSSTGSAPLPSGTTAERDGTPLAGFIRFNSTLGSFEGYDGTSWGSIGGGATGGGADAVFIENDQTVTTDYTIPADKNAMSTGTISIDSGVTVTVSSGSRYVVI